MEKCEGHSQNGEKEREVEVQERAEASTSRPWRYSQIMAFLNPFMEDRATTSNFPASQGGCRRYKGGYRHDQPGQQ